MASTPAAYPNRVNLDNCAKEPIHIIGKTQSHGVLLACDAVEMVITQAGENTADFFGIPVDEILGKPLAYLLGEEQVQELQLQLKDPDEKLSKQVVIAGKKFLMLCHFSEENLVMDFEPLRELQDPLYFENRLREILDKFQAADSVEQLSGEAVRLTRKMFGYNRVMVYRFDEDWNGEVIAESKEEELESWLGLHYPATDIPEQSRKLFLKQRLRIITNVHYHPVPIKPEISPLTGKPLDISKSGLRAVSPIHIEYLKNMGVGASLSAAIVVKDKLWGLLACHHLGEKYLDFYQRESCRFLTRIFSTEVTLHEASHRLTRSEKTENTRRRLVAQMKEHRNIVTALNRDNVKFTELFNCGGGAIFNGDQWELRGRTPSVEELANLLNNYIKQQSKSLFLTRNLSEVFPEAEAYQEKASGVLYLKISENKYIFWFKPEVVQEVTWGGNPQKKVFYNEQEQRLSPRKSFEKWTENLTGISEAWEELDASTARTFRENLSHVLLEQQREEIEALNEKLLQANRELELFSYGLSHDLRAPIRGMEGFLNVLQEDYGEGLGKEGNQLLEMSKGLIPKMNALIDNILEYSRLGHVREIAKQEIKTEVLIKEVLELFNLKANFKSTSIEIDPELPVMKGDYQMLFQLWSNVISNALKYSSEQEAPIVQVGARNLDGRNVFFVKDNGIGIDPGQQQKIFETFKRAVGSRFEGTGIGLAIVKRIIEKHGGKVWLESKPGEGSVFYFYLDPNKEESL